MGVNDPNNAWWMDVLENGPASPHARFFDIDWHPIHPEMQDKVLLRVPLTEAVPRAARDVWTLNVATLRALWDIVRGRGTASLAGPVRIVQEAAAEVKHGLAEFAGVLANISVGVAIFNFLPVPALDGGRLVFLGIELVSGRRVNHRTETAVHLVGFLFLIVLFLAVTLFGDLKLGHKLFGWG